MVGKWTPFKDLFGCIEQFVAHEKPDVLLKTKSLLTCYKSEFLSLLLNSPKNSEDRRRVKECDKTPLVISGESRPKTYTEDFIKDVLVLSDFLNLNELSSFELLLAAELQEANYLHYGRCLVSILMYWDGRKNLVGSLRGLILCRKGSTWSFPDLSNDAQQIATSFTDNLQANGLVKRILTLLKDINVKDEIEKIDHNPHLRGVTPRYLKEVKSLIEGVVSGLTECLFFFAVQSGLTYNEVVDIVNYLKENAEIANSVLTPVTMGLLFSVFYSVLPPRDQFQNASITILDDCNHKLITDKDFLPGLHNLLTASQSSIMSSWKIPEVLACLQFFWSQSISRLLTLNINSPPVQWNCIIEQEETVLDKALAGNVFTFMKDKIVSSRLFHQEEFYVRAIHEGLTDLIRLMPLKTKEIRNQGDDEARSLLQSICQGESPPDDYKNDFEALMELMNAVYKKDPLNLQLSLEYWCPSANHFDGTSHHHQRSRLNQRQTLLYKFVRMSADQLPHLLYISYIKMLIGLSSGKKSARAAFEMLRLNGSSSFNVEERGAVSWDSFFRSCHRYHNELQQKPTSSSSLMMMNARSMTSSHTTQRIHPREVEALCRFMQLIAVISKHDDIARHAFYENTQWCACEVMFGLLQCPIPVGLKADILLALAYIVQDRDLVPALLQMTQSSKLLQDTSYSVHNKSSGIIAELEEVESKDEEYPLTRAFLKYLHSISTTLCDSIISHGNKTSPWPMNDYLNYVIEVVFNKALTRSYNRSEEKWQVIVKCLKLFIKILDNYSPALEDQLEIYSQQNSSSRVFRNISKKAGSPGHNLLMHVYSEGNFFRMIMNIIKSALEYLQLFQKDDKFEKYLIKAADLSLQFILISLEFRDSFFDTLRESKQAMLIAGLDKLLLGVNPQTGTSDYIVNIASLIIYNSSHPQLTLQAVKTISHLCFSSAINQRDVLTSLVTSCCVSTQENIFQGFVEVLDLACDDMGNNFDATMKQRRICQEYIVRLMIHCLDQPHPNLALLMLGFDYGVKPVQANLQDPAVHGYRTCLHSLMSILTCSADGRAPPCVQNNPTLAQLCYNLIYKLCKNPDTSSSVLRYLRSSYEFFTKHVKCLPFTTQQIDTSATNQVLLQQSWLMKCVAIEIYSLMTNQQRDHAQQIIQILFDSGDEINRSLSNITSSSTSMFQDPFMSLNMSLSRTFESSNNFTFNQSKLKNVESLKLLQIIDVLDLSQATPSKLILQQFRLSDVEEVISKCEVKHYQGSTYCDVKALHELLEASLESLNGAEDANRKLLAEQDLQNILRHVVERNQMRESIHAKISFLNSWKQAFEISIASRDLIPKEKYEQVLLSVATSIIRKVRDCRSSPEMVMSFSSSVFSIFSAIKDIIWESVESGDKIMKKLKSSFAVSLKIIIQGIIEWLTQSGVSQRVRPDLYASLLCYLNLCTRPKAQETQSIDTIINLSKEDVYTKMSRENTRLFKTFGDSLINLLCKDTCTGNGICRILAYACMDAVIQIDSNYTWINFISKNGYLSNVARSFIEEDEYLCLNSPNDFNIRTVYIYEQKMALLCSISQTPEGARAVLDAGILSIFSECRFFGVRSYIDQDPSQLSTHRQLTFPAFRLCSAILGSLGGRFHHLASSTVLQFLLSHSDSLLAPLFDTNIDYTNLEVLTEWKLLTGLLSQMPDQYCKSNAQNFDPMVPGLHNEPFSYLLRVQRQLVAMISKILLTEKQLFELKEQILYTSHEKTPSFEIVCSSLNEIGANIFSFFRVFSLSYDQSSPFLYFAPFLGDSHNRFGADNQKATIGTLIRILKSAVKSYKDLSDSTSSPTSHQVRIFIFLSSDLSN